MANHESLRHDLFDSLNRIIFSELVRSSEESHRPKADADASDYLLKVTNGRVQQLRRIREELENVLSAPDIEGP